MRSLDDFLPRVMPYALACPEPVAAEKLREVAARFLKASRLWRFQDTFTLDGTPCQPLSAPSQAVVLEIEDAEVDGCRLVPKPVMWLDHHMKGWRTAAPDSGAPRYITQLAPSTLAVAPNGAGTLELGLILGLAADASLVPDFLYDLHADDIAKGAIGEILIMPETEYANPSLGVAFTQRFQAALDGARLQSVRGQQRAPLRTRGSYF